MLDRTTPPPFVRTTSFSLIQPEEKKLPNGARVFLVPGGFQDVVKIELIFEAGRWFEDACGAAYFTSHLLSKGTQEKSSFQIARLFDQYGAHLEISPGLDFVSIALYSVNKNLAPVLDLLVEILSFPTFPEKELKQTKSVYIQNLKINKEKTSFVASHLFRKSLYGDRHPYGREVEDADVSVLKVKHLEKHFSELMHSPKVFVSGKIEQQTRGIILAQIEKLKSGKKVHPLSPPINAPSVKQHVEKKESVQSSVRMGLRSVLRSHSDYVPILFVSHILGGYFGSRLMKNIREEKGLTYGISASIHGMKNDSYLVVGADVNKENVDLTFEEIRKELKLLRSSPISEGELETTQNHFIGSLQSEISTPFAHADKIKTIKLFDLPDDHYQKLIGKIEKITPSEISAISEQYFNERDFAEVAVG
jgi:zinc protease